MMKKIWMGTVGGILLINAVYFGINFISIVKQNNRLLEEYPRLSSEIVEQSLVTDEAQACSTYKEHKN